MDSPRVSQSVRGPQHLLDVSMVSGVGSPEGKEPASLRARGLNQSFDIKQCK